MITNQAYLFLIFIANGIIIGILFDFFRILRRSFKTGDIITYLEDFIFWILTGIVILYSVFVFNNGEIRLYLFFGIAIGIISYMLIASAYVIKINVAIINFLKKILGILLNFLSIPFKIVYKLLRKIFFKPISFIIINLRKNSTNLLKNMIKISKNQKKIENNAKS